MIYAGQGVHWAEAWPQLKGLAELLAIPVTTSLGGKSAFPETHPLSLGSGGSRDAARRADTSSTEADVIFGIGCSFTETNFGIKMPGGKTIIHSTLDPNHLNKDIAVHSRPGRRCQAGAATRCSRRCGKTVKANRDAGAVAAEIAADPTRSGWRSGCRSSPPTTRRSIPTACCGTCSTRSTSPTPSSPTMPAARATSSRRSGSRRRRCPIIGWGKTTQLGYGLGLAMGAKLAKPDKLCINVWGDAAIGFTGMDFETAVRERIPIMSILLNNFSMAIELKVMPISTEKYRSTDISGDYAAMARAFGGYGERVTKPEDIVPAIKRGIAADAGRRRRCCSSSSPPRRPRCPGPEPEGPLTQAENRLPAAGTEPPGMR